MTDASLLLADDRWDHHMGWGGWWWMIIWAAVLLVGIVVAVWVARSVGSSGSGPHHEPGGDPLDSARQILAERFARGELTSEEYRERLEHLE